MNRGIWRILTEGGICLALSVILVRFFLIESYMIETGSMAPTLLGYHRQVVCPACGIVFAVGAFQQGQSDGNQAFAECPNCQLKPLECESLRRMEGDQLLVNKMAYPLLPLDRWDVIVFRNPDDAQEAFAKRVIALPNEQLTVVRGDIYVSGNIQRKPWVVQKAMRIPVYLDEYRPGGSDEHFFPRWTTNQNRSVWKQEDDGFTISASSVMDWLSYRQTVRSHPDGICTVMLTSWPEELPAPTKIDPGLTFDPQKLTLSCKGVFNREIVTQIRQQHPQLPDTFFDALESLCWQSHESLIYNDYAYNHARNRPANAELAHDFMLSCDITCETLQGVINFQLTDGSRIFRLELDLDQEKLTLFMEGNPVREASLSKFMNKARTISVDFSLFDACTEVVINDYPACERFLYHPEPPQAKNLTIPARIGVKNVNARFQHLALYRDVAYEIDEADLQRVNRQMYADEIFVMGDNNPASLDSRKWEPGSVTRSLLIGKPLVVHLPSRPGVMKVGGEQKKIRLPDFARIRWIH
jgi:signal peptidase I